MFFLESLGPRAARMNGSQQPHTATDSRGKESRFDFKTSMERVAAVLMLVACSPLLLALMLLIRATSRGPAVFRQTRTGKDQRDFTIFKLRTMRVDAEKLTGPAWSRRGDPRITPVGRFLRCCHLDELPQLMNVARGEMAFVGPRPEHPVIIQRLIQDVPNYHERHTVKPGITGLAQINLPPDTSLDDVRRKLELDLHYIRTANGWLELRIVCCTCLRLCGLRGDGLARILGVRMQACCEKRGTDQRGAAAVREAPSPAALYAPVSPDTLASTADYQTLP